MPIGQDTSSPSQMIQTHQQLKSQVMQLGSQQNEMAHQLRAALDTFPQGQYIARPIYVPANMPSHRDGLCFFAKHKGHFIRACPRKRDMNIIHKNSCHVEKHVKKLQ